MQKRIGFAWLATLFHICQASHVTCDAFVDSQKAILYRMHIICMRSVYIFYSVRKYSVYTLLFVEK